MHQNSTTTALDVGHAHLRFIKANTRFLLAQNFFLASAIAGMDGNENLETRRKDFDNHVQPDYKDAFTFLSAQLFVTYLSSFEVLLQDLISSVIKKNPKKLGGSQFRLADVLEAENTDELISKAIDEYLNKLMYKKPNDYLTEVCELLTTPKSIVEEHWPKYVEAKARRDLGVHAVWKCNPIYIRKLSEVGVTSDLKVGESAVPDVTEYLRPLANVLTALAENFVNAVKRKHCD